MSQSGARPITVVANLEERYRLLTRIGSGGMAEVFLAVQLGESSFKRLVVVKRIHSLGHTYDNAMQMFVDEARTVAQLSHPHIVKLYDLSRLKGDVCIAMEYVDGESLEYICKKLRKTDGAIPLQVVCKLMLEACEALQYAHNTHNTKGEPLRLVHRDIGPQNLLLGCNGYLKIIDFGIAKSSTQSQLTSPDLLKGRLSYIAPETYMQEAIDGRADLYALGLVFFELATMRKPFITSDKSDPAAVMNMVLSEELPKPSEICRGLPSELDALIAKATNKNPDERYQTGEEFAEDIRRFTETHGMATTGTVRTWFHKAFAERLEVRRSVERRAMEKAATLHSREQLNGTPITSQTMTSAFYEADTLPEARHSSSVQQKKVNPYIFLVVLFVLVACMAVLFHQLFWKTTPQPTVSQIITTPASSKESKVHLETIPPQAEVSLDGEPVGSTGTKGLVFQLKPGKRHEVEVTKIGYEPKTLRLKGEAGKQKMVEVVLAKIQPTPLPEGDGEDTLDIDETKETTRSPGKSRKGKNRRKKKGEKARDEDEKTAVAKADNPEPTEEPQTDPPDSPDQPDKTEPDKNEPDRIDPVDNSEKPQEPKEVASKKPPSVEKPEKKLLSGSGNWSGSQVANRGCTHCHGSKAPRLKWSSKTKRQWEHFFKRKRHRRNGKLENYFSKAELERVKTYILSKRKEDKKSGIAGVK